MTVHDYARLGLEAVTARPGHGPFVGAEVPPSATSDGPPRYGLMALTTAVTLGIFFGTLYGIRRTA